MLNDYKLLILIISNTLCLIDLTFCYFCLLTSYHKNKNKLLQYAKNKKHKASTHSKYAVKSYLLNQHLNCQFRSTNYLSAQIAYHNGQRN